MFGATLPAEIKNNAKKINSEGGLKLDKDQNTNKSIFKRLKRAYPKNPGSIVNEMFNIAINLWSFLIVNFTVIFYNYFVPFAVLAIQMLGFFNNLDKYAGHD